VADDLLRLRCGEVKFRVVRAQMLCHGSGILGLIKPGFLEADRKRSNRSHSLLLHEGDDGGRVDPAGKERTQRHVCQGLQPDSL